MYLRFHLDDNGKRVYTFKFHDEKNDPTLSAHPGKCPTALSNLGSEIFTRRYLPEGAHEVQGTIQSATNSKARDGFVRIALHY